jgi:hypothetical protein
VVQQVEAVVEAGAVADEAERNRSQLENSAKTLVVESFGGCDVDQTPQRCIYDPAIVSDTHHFPYCVQQIQ